MVAIGWAAVGIGGRFFKLSLRNIAYLGIGCGFPRNGQGAFLLDANTASGVLIVKGGQGIEGWRGLMGIGGRGGRASGSSTVVEPD